MQTPKIFEDYRDVQSALSFLGLDLENLKVVARKAASARNESVFFDPVNAPGLLSYIYGTRALREALVPTGSWAPDSNLNIESVVNHDRGLKIIFQNVDIACALQQPRAISSKGQASRRLIDNASMSLFPELDREVEIIENAAVWYFCVSVNGDSIKAELSRPSSIRESDGQFDDFFERIFILNEEGGAVGVPGDIDDGPTSDDDLEIWITRKT